MNGANNQMNKWERKQIQMANEHNSPEPDNCDECGVGLRSGAGHVLYCPDGHGVKWEDAGQAIAGVI